MDDNKHDKQWEGTRVKLEEAALLHTFLPLQSFLSEPVSFPEAPQVDGLSAGRVLPRHINLPQAPNVRRGHLTTSLTGANKDSFGSSSKITQFKHTRKAKKSAGKHNWSLR